MAEAPNTQRKMHRTAFACFGVAVGMVGLAYASVPLYDLFCKVTGFDGTPVVRANNASQVVDRTISVRFDANVSPALSWRFAPEKPEVQVKLGETTTVYYKVTNTGDKPATGIATYNVQPDLAGSYFSKLECFCFTEQTLQPGETLESAVVFYVDPRLAQDTDVKDLTSITLSYTYFPSKAGKPVAEATSSTKPIAQ
ncbi:cytochrome c oxidase assembly protein [Microvirga sp. M2]|uniref:cytochrome c oxidase assembly protein n=1 Tax=Microvirga sp. M2 TaxID=3073270 RepID=UPI0039C313ED